MLQTRGERPLSHRLSPLPLPSAHIRFPRQPLLRSAEQDEPPLERHAGWWLGQQEEREVRYTYDHVVHS